MERCETCGDQATQWDYDQLMYFCDRHVQQADLTISLGDVRPCARCGHAKAAHEGHCHRIGSPPPTHCSQGCGCAAWLPRIGG